MSNCGPMKCYWYKTNNMVFVGQGTSAKSWPYWLFRVLYRPAHFLLSLSLDWLIPHWRSNCILLIMRNNVLKGLWYHAFLYIYIYLVFITGIFNSWHSRLYCPGSIAKERIWCGVWLVSLFIRSDSLSWSLRNVIGVCPFSVSNFVLMLLSECNSYSVSLHNAVIWLE